MPARASALGGSTMNIWGDDINLYFSNPALLNQHACNKIAVNYSNYVNDINYGNVAYAKHVKGIATFAAGIQFLSYGKFDRRDEFDVHQGTFAPADYSFNLSAARRLKDTCFSVGATLKTIYSHYDIYNSWGSVLDFGITYAHKSNFTASILAKNVGLIWKPYNKTSANEKIQSDVQIGLSYKVKKAPFRVGVIYDQVTKWDLTYLSPLDEANQIDPFTNQPVKKTTPTSRFFDKFGRHWIFQAEVVITKNLNLRVGYNVRQHLEMALPDKRTASGLSLGFGFGINRFTFNYAWAKYNLAGNNHTFSIVTNLGAYTKTFKKAPPTDAPTQ